MAPVEGSIGPDYNIQTENVLDAMKFSLHFHGPQRMRLMTLTDALGRNLAFTAV